MTPRWIELDGAHNARDLGGLPAATGRTRPGVLLRADAPDALSAADVDHLVATVGLAHVIDLRSSAERAERGRGLLGATSVTYSELEVMDSGYLDRRRSKRAAALVAGIDPAVMMAEGYAELLELGAPSFVAALHRIVEPGGAPALVHCAAGKDRTGIFVALLLAVAGVEREAIVADYAATAQRMPAIIERLHHAGSFHALAEQLPAFVFEAHPTTMTTFLDELERSHGGAEAFLRSHGLDADASAAWCTMFIAASAD